MHSTSISIFWFTFLSSLPSVAYCEASPSSALCPPRCQPWPPPPQDPMSHRVIEKRRRDRMNNCLAHSREELRRGWVNEKAQALHWCTKVLFVEKDQNISHEFLLISSCLWHENSFNLMYYSHKINNDDKLSPVLAILDDLLYLIILLF